MEFRKNSDGTVTLERYTGSNEDVVIPEGVYDIRSNAFHGCSIRSVKFPDSLRVIGDDAFGCCLHLSKIKFGCGPLKIGQSAFESCLCLEEVDLCGVEEIGEFAFLRCERLKNVKLHEGLKTIKCCAFLLSQGMKEISLPSSVYELNGGCFEHVDKIEIKGQYIPKRFLSAFSNSGGSAGLTISINGNIVMIPKRIDLKYYADIVELLQNFNRKSGERASFFQIALLPEDSLNMALDAYSSGDPEAELYLRENFVPLVHKMGKEDVFLNICNRLRELGLMSKDLAEEAFPAIQRKEWTRAVSYMLEFFNENSEEYGDEYEEERFAL